MQEFWYWANNTKRKDLMERGGRGADPLHLPPGSATDVDSFPISRYVKLSFRKCQVSAQEESII